MATLREVAGAARLVISQCPRIEGNFMTLERGLAAMRSGDYAAAYAYFRPLAEQGQSLAQYCVGLLYREGKSVPQNNAEAVHWYRKAADQGHPNAQLNLGIHHQYGWGTPQDFNEALKYHQLAAAAGEMKAQLNLHVLQKLLPLLPLLLGLSPGNISALVGMLKYEDQILLTPADSPNDAICRIMVYYEWVRLVTEPPLPPELEQFQSRRYTSTHRGREILPRIIYTLMPRRQVPIPERPTESSSPGSGVQIVRTTMTQYNRD